MTQLLTIYAEIPLAQGVHLKLTVESKLFYEFLFLSFDSHVRFFYRYYHFPYAYTSFVIFNCFAYSSSGTPNFLAIDTCDGVSLTVLRPVFVLRFAEATCCTGVDRISSPVLLILANLCGNSSLILLSISE